MKPGFTTTDGEKTRADADIRCLHCGYSLQGLDRKRCPECGRCFDLRDPASYDSPERREELRRRRRLTYLLPLTFIIASGVCALLGGLAIGAIGAWSQPLVFWILAGVILIPLFVRARVRRWILVGHVDANRASERFWNVCIAALALGSVVLFTTVVRTCPHGRTIGVGGVGIAFSDNGGPCRNASPTLSSLHIAGNVYVWEAF